MWGWLAWRSARRTASLLKQESRRPSNCVTEPFDTERYEAVTKKQNEPSYVNIVDLARTMVLSTLAIVVLCLFTDLNWWWVTAPLASYALYGATCRTYSFREMTSDGR